MSRTRAAHTVATLPSVTQPATKKGILYQIKEMKLSDWLMIFMTIIITWYTIKMYDLGVNESQNREAIEKLSGIAEGQQGTNEKLERLVIKQGSTNSSLASSVRDLDKQLNYLAGILAGTNEGNSLNRSETLLKRKVALEALVGYSHELNRVAMQPDEDYNGNALAQLAFLKSSDSLWILCLSNPVLLEEDSLATNIRKWDGNVRGWLAAYKGTNGHTIIISHFEGKTFTDSSKANILRTFDRDFNDLINNHMNLLMQQVNPFIVRKKKELGIPAGSGI